MALEPVACGGETEGPVAPEEPAKAAQEASHGESWESVSGSECRSNVRSPIKIDTEVAIEAKLADITHTYTAFNMKI